MLLFQIAMDGQIAGYAGAADLGRVFHNAYPAGEHPARHRPQGDVRLGQGGVKLHIPGNSVYIHPLKNAGAFHALVAAHAAELGRQAGHLR